jgi:hypothetical protein
LLTHGNTDHDLTSIYGRTASGLNWESMQETIQKTHVSWSGTNGFMSDFTVSNIDECPESVPLYPCANVFLSTMLDIRPTATDFIGSNLWLWGADHKSEGSSNSVSLYGAVVQASRATFYSLYAEHHGLVCLHSRSAWNGEERVLRESRVGGVLLRKRERLRDGV